MYIPCMERGTWVLLALSLWDRNGQCHIPEVIKLVVNEEQRTLWEINSPMEQSWDISSEDCGVKHSYTGYNIAPHYSCGPV